MPNVNHTPPPPFPAGFDHTPQPGPNGFGPHFDPRTACPSAHEFSRFGQPGPFQRSYAAFAAMEQALRADLHAAWTQAQSHLRQARAAAQSAAGAANGAPGQAPFYGHGRPGPTPSWAGFAPEAPTHPYAAQAREALRQTWQTYEHNRQRFGWTTPPAPPEHGPYPFVARQAEDVPTGRARSAPRTFAVTPNMNRQAVRTLVDSMRAAGFERSDYAALRTLLMDMRGTAATADAARRRLEREFAPRLHGIMQCDGLTTRHLLRELARASA